MVCVTASQNPKTNTIRRVLLMSLPTVIGRRDNPLIHVNSFQLGIAYLGAVLRENGFTVKVLDCTAEAKYHIRTTSYRRWKEIGLSNKKITAYIEDFSPDLIGMTIPFSHQHYVASEIGQLIKNVFPKIPIVVGGNHVSAIQKGMDNSPYDYLVVGEGEYALLQLIDSINRALPGESLPGFLHGKIPHFENRVYIDHLDDLPFPALDLLPLKKLWSSSHRWINMITTRGCVYDCNFCSIHTVMGYKIRKRSIENIVAEIEHWKNIYDIEEVYFEDDNIAFYKEWFKNLFRTIARNKFGIRFYARNGIRADSLDREMLQLMKMAGFQDFPIDPESGSQRILDQVIKKQMKLADCKKVVKLASEVGLGVSAFFVMGFPEETREDIEATISFARELKRLGCSGFWLTLASPFPGTRLFQQCMEQNLFPDNLDYRKLRQDDYIIRHKIFTTGELKSVRKKALNDLTPAIPIMCKRILKALMLLIENPSFFITKLRFKVSQYL